MPLTHSTFRQIPFALLALAVGCAQQQQPPREHPVLLGIDVLKNEHFAALAGKRVGVIVNPASVDADRQPTLRDLIAAPNVNVTALFGPEHGVWGDAYAGGKVDDDVDPETGLKAFSLFGKTRKPTPQMLADVDVMVFDLQGIGARSYTFLSTMKTVMQACAEQNKELVILDRPNPLGGERIEGGEVEKGFESFVSYLDVPYLHGMTMGELALMTRAESFPDYHKLTVIKMDGWRRDMTWADTGLDWIPTSPHIPHVSSVAAYAATGITGELYQVSNGVGYTQPFELVGSPTTDGIELAKKMNALWRGERGIYFRPVRFKPFYGPDKGEVCGGVQVHINPHTAPSLVEINYRLIEALGGKRMLKIATTPATKPASRPATRPANAEPLDISPFGRRAMFDKVTGSAEAGEILLKGGDLAPLFARWWAEDEAFRRRRQPFLLYH